MNQRQRLVERRKNERFRPRDGAFAVLRPRWPHSTKLGEIINVSRGGLAFRYVSGKDLSNESMELDICLPDEGFYMGKVPFDTISDLQETNKSPFSSGPHSRCGVQFGELTLNQVSQLEHFILHHTVPEA